jgi:hypothetical protein
VRPSGLVEGTIMSAESWQRLKWRGWIVCVLCGIAVGLVNGGWQGGIKGALFGNLGSSMLLGLLASLERISRRAMIGGLVGAGLLVAAEILVLSLHGRSVPALWIGVTLPIMALSGFQVGVVLSASRARFVLVGALIGALPMPLIGLVAYTIAGDNRDLLQLISVTLFGALLVAVLRCLTTRSLANLWRWAIGGAIFGLVFIGIVQLSLPPSSPMKPAEMMSALKFLTAFGAMLGGWLGAMVSSNSLYPGGPKLFNDQNKS